MSCLDLSKPWSWPFTSVVAAHSGRLPYCDFASHACLQNRKYWQLVAPRHISARLCRPMHNAERGGCSPQPPAQRTTWRTLDSPVRVRAILHRRSGQHTKRPSQSEPQRQRCGNDKAGLAHGESLHDSPIVAGVTSETGMLPTLRQATFGLYRPAGRSRVAVKQVCRIVQ